MPLADGLSEIAQGPVMADAAPTSKDITETRIGSYRLIEPLGSGGMSSVYRAVHDQTGHEVAIKVLSREMSKRTTLLQRFLREAKSAEALEHPNIVAIFDRGSDDGQHYLVLELVAGGDLNDRVRSKGPLEIAQAVMVIKAAAQGLSHAAGKGLIHRDIKPANILMTPEGQVKVTDLGLALNLEEEDERVTRDGTTVGTVDYMSPEQARDSRATSVRSDIYSLGCTLYFLLSGKPPFSGGAMLDKLKRHLTEPPPDVRTLRPEVPEPLARLVQRMMAKKADDRFANYEQLITALDALPPPPDPDEPQLVPLDDEVPDPLMAKRPGSSAIGSGIRRSPGGSPSSGSGSAISKSGTSRTTPSRAASATQAPSSTNEVSAPLLRQILEEDEEAEAEKPQYFGPSQFRSKGLSLQQYITRGLLIGLLIIVLGVGLPWLVRTLKSLRSQAKPASSAPASSQELDPAGDAGGQGSEADRPLAPGDRGEP